MSWLALARPGDWAVALAGLALVAWLGATLWHGGRGEKAVIRSGGAVFAQLSLAKDQTITVPGPLGESIIEVKDGRVRVARDPSPRQYCVHQGWLSRAGEAALCLPNEVSVELAGERKAYDTLNY